MLNIKKIFALSLVALATLACLTSFRMRQTKMLCEAGNIKTPECFEKTNDYSIVNILSLKFR